MCFMWILEATPRQVKIEYEIENERGNHRLVILSTETSEWNENKALRKVDKSSFERTD